MLCADVAGGCRNYLPKQTFTRYPSCRDGGVGGPSSGHNDGGRDLIMVRQILTSLAVGALFCAATSLAQAQTAAPPAAAPKPAKKDAAKPATAAPAAAPAAA